MTKVISIALKAHYAQGTTTTAFIVDLTRADGFVMAVTLGHDRPISYDSLVYEPSLAMAPTTVETSAALNVDNLEARGALMAIGIAEEDINAGLWDMCEVRVRRVNWADLTMGSEHIKRGNLGEISTGRGTYNTEVRGITQYLQQTVGSIVSPSCKNRLFDTKCGLAATEGVRKFSGVAVTAFTSQRAFTASSLAQAAGFFDGGEVTWTTGANAGLSKEVRSHTAGGVFVLQEPMPYPIAVSDQAVFFEGCLKRKVDCKAKSNYPRFGGFPEVPGQDQMFRGPA